MERHQELAELQRNWRAPAELRTSTPREVELSGGGVALLCLAGLLFAGAIASAVGLSRLASRQAGETLALEQSGLRTQATVTRAWRSGSGKDSQPRVSYEFEYEGRIYRGTSKVPKRIYSRLGVGAGLPVRFVPARPELNHPAEWDTRDMPWWFPPATAAALIATGLLLLFLVHRQKQLLSDGRPALARVTAHRRGQHGNHSLVYEFPLYGGGLGKGSGGDTRKPPPIGSTLCVLYDRENPKRNSPYPFSLVRIVR